MKKMLLPLVVLFFNMVRAQVGIGTITPVASAQLDVTSINKGFLLPRMTAVQRDSIVGPVAGLMVYCTNCGPNGELEVHNGSSWRNVMGGMASLPAIGQPYQGGILYYLLQPGDPGYIAGETHGFIATASDQSISAQWGCPGTVIPGADSLTLGTGNLNTIDIMAGCATAGIAARICGDLVLNGFSDWYLPSKDELNKLYISRAAVGGFSNTNYWSSSEYFNGANHAWLQNFADGSQGPGFKSVTTHVRAVRAF